MTDPSIHIFSFEMKRKPEKKRMICGGIGPHAYRVAEKFDVEVYVISGIAVAEAIRLAAEGKLPAAIGPTAHQHPENGNHHGHHQ